MEISHATREVPQLAQECVFPLDGEEPDSRSESASDRPDPLQGSAPEDVGPSATEEEQEDEDIADARKTMPIAEEEANVCSICLDEFGDADPAVPTSCRHHYHLQCIMSWAQRSHECPLCFKTLRLQDEVLQELLPFGEYVSPQAAASSAASLESWELERLLLRLAVSGQRGDRPTRAGRRARREPPATAAQAIPDGGGGGSARRRSSQDAGPSGGGAAAAAAAYPASWPPTAGELGELPSSSGAAGLSLRAASHTLKARISSLRLRESFSKTTREIKSLFSPGRPSKGGGDGGPTS